MLVPPARKKWVSLVPAVTVIPDPLAYIKVVAVKISAQAGSVSPLSQEEVGKYGANSHSTGGSHLSQIFWEYENLSSLNVIQLIQL